MLNTFAISGLLIVLTSTAMALAMFAQARQRLHRIWGGFCLSVMLWGLGAYNVATTENADLSLLWWKTAYIGVIFIPILFTHFVFVFLGIRRRLVLAALYILGFEYLIANLYSNAFIGDVHWMFDRFYYLSPTTLYNTFVALFLALVVYSHVLLAQAYVTAGGNRRAQIQYFFIASFVGYLGGSFSFLPVYQIPFYPYPNLTVFLYPLIMGYAIFRHQLLDIRVIATQLFVLLLWVFIFVRVLLSPFGSQDQLFNMLLLAMTVVIGIFLMRSVLREIAQRERIEKLAGELTQANEKLAALDKAKSEFLSVASHQLYTPLTALRGYLSMVQEGSFGTVPEKLQNVHGILASSTNRLIDLIRNLLDISRIESGRLELAIESVDLAQMARDLLTELTPNAERKKLRLTFEAPAGDTFRVAADAQRLRQVLLNTLDNAIKYTASGSVTVRVYRDGDRLVYSVTDSGKGMTADDLARLFAKFTRVGGHERHETEGVGLGLYVARQIVREHHGDIRAESPGLGKGSTFFVMLPAEGSPDALPVGSRITVGIKAAEAGQRPEDAPTAPEGSAS